MQATQQQLIESYMRVRVFLESLPSGDAPALRPARRVLDQVLERLRTHVGTQAGAPAMGRAGRHRQRWLMEAVRDEYMRPIVTIARAQIAPTDDVGLAVLFRLPRASIGPIRLVAACDGMLEALPPFAETFITEGLPSDFIERFARARDDLARSMGERADTRLARSGARLGLQAALRLGRLTVNRLDAMVRALYRGDEVTLLAWRQAKRVHLLPGARRGGRGEPSDAPLELVTDVSPVSAQAVQPALLGRAA